MIFTRSTRHGHPRRPRYRMSQRSSASGVRHDRTPPFVRESTHRKGSMFIVKAHAGVFLIVPRSYPLSEMVGLTNCLSHFSPTPVRCLTLIK